jgi:hypothetical protein
VNDPAEPIPDLIADVRLYAPDEGGRNNQIRATFRCPCAVTNINPAMMHSAQLLLGSEPMSPGESRRIGFAFLTTEGADAMRQAGKFYLWDGKFFAEAVIVE